MSSIFFDLGGIRIPLPSQTSTENIRDLYTDGYPDAAVRPHRISEINRFLVGDIPETSVDDPQGFIHIEGAVTGLPGDPPCPDTGPGAPEDDCA